MSTPIKDPLKSFGGVIAATLILEAIVVLLAMLVVAKADGGPTTFQLVVVAVLGLVLIVGCRFARRPWAVLFGLAMQGVLVLAGLIVPVLAIVGVIFAAVWIYFLIIRRLVARKMAEGTLPSQQVD
ncbi:uncharacterized protein DUF4233 [Herbihabitans rhizosphaerae]|uniref:Uncharacterized protein DUF4233 n=1 Tax=Herbihabitans rhizosphaerae TaxID=1872711 RepID=A0A4Q7KGQ7_9PSEU|nr:DUF4233 domain-containing protein [Herbihabitans rhizosphaerae]RZS31372.1 uncharacterized protein DUF4233 [Herbihabitans rhizosphaerae]